MTKASSRSMSTSVHLRCLRVQENSALLCHADFFFSAAWSPVCLEEGEVQEFKLLSRDQDKQLESPECRQLNS